MLKELQKLNTLSCKLVWCETTANRSVNKARKCYISTIVWLNNNMEEREWEGDGLVSGEVGCPFSKLQLVLNPVHCTHKICHVKKDIEVSDCR
jgi:hypothetical protein